MPLRAMTGAPLLCSCERPRASAVAPVPNADPLHTTAVQQLTSVIVYTSGHSVISTAAAVVLTGIHYRRAIEQGVVQGRPVGELVLRRVRTRADSPVAADGGSR